MNYITEFIDLIELSGKELEITDMKTDKDNLIKTIEVKNKILFIWLNC